jgi:hypothetical protein
MFRATRSLVGLGWPASRFGNSRSYLQRPLAIEIARSSSTKSGPPPPKPSIDREHERKLAHETLKPTPSEVTIDSTTRVGWEKKKASSSSAQDSEPAFGESLQHDLVCIINDVVQAISLG